MPHYFMFITDEWSNLGGFTRPTSRAITQAMQEAALGLNLGQWVGPMPRITRTSNLVRGVHTTVAWLFRLSDGVTNVPHALDLVQNNLRSALRRVSGSFSLPSFIAYSPVTNGSLQWWATGLASQTRTRDVLAPLLTSSRENPIGPDFIQETGGVTGTLQTAVSIGLIGLAGYVTYKIWQGVTETPPDEKTNRSGRAFGAGKWLGGLLKDESGSAPSSSRSSRKPSSKPSGKTAAKEAAQKEREAKEADRAAKRAAKEAERAAKKAEREEERFAAKTTRRMKTRTQQTAPGRRADVGAASTARLGKQRPKKKGKTRTRRRPSDAPANRQMSLPSHLERATVRE